MPTSSGGKPEKPLSSVMQGLIDHVNERSNDIATEKAALLALFQGGLVSRQADIIVVTDPEDPLESEKPLSFAQAFGRLEGAEGELNALAAYVILAGAEEQGELTVPED